MSLHPSSSATPKRTVSAASAGSVSSEQFRAAFESVPTTARINTSRDLINEVQKQAAILEKVDNDWSKRVKALQALRSLMLQGAADNNEFVTQCHQLVGAALQLSVKDLRSQVCREACITVGYFCEKLGTHFWKVAEMILPITIGLAQNSAKVMASSGSNSSHYIAKYVHHPKVLQLIIQHSTHKSREIRRTITSLVGDILANWDQSILERHWPELISAIKASIYDADLEVRNNARITYDILQQNYSHRAEMLLQDLDPAKQRMLTGRSSTASSTHSITSERDTLMSSQRGFYGAQQHHLQQQNAFLNKRSASDLHHTMRKLNLGTAHRPAALRPNVVRANGIGNSSAASTRPTPLHHQPPPPPLFPKPTNTPARKHPIPPNVVTSATASSRRAEQSKAVSQPGSRSNSPSRLRGSANRPQVVVNGKATTNLPSSAAPPPPPTAAGEPTAHQLYRALKNVDMQARGIRPNVVKHTTNSTTSAVGEHRGTLANNSHPHSAISPVTPGRDSVQHSNSSTPNSNKDFYGLSRRQEEVLKKISSEEGAAGTVMDYSDGGQNSGGGASNANKWYFTSAQELAKDHSKQEGILREIVEALMSDGVEIEKEIEGALAALSHMIRENAITLWNDYFNQVFFCLLQVIAQPFHTYNLKLNALRTLKDLCTSQPRRLVLKPELAVMSVLNAHNCDDASVVRVAEECGSILAAHLPTSTSLKLLTLVIDDENTQYHQLSGAIKMLIDVLRKCNAEEEQQLLPQIVPRMMKCYENSQSIVRRSAIMCLVEISKSVGIDVLKPHLNASTLKLVEVYRDRQASKKATEAHG